ncbi:phosphate ABC transporter permease subunit PstC [Chromohalobacter canadensis]|uniref:Phosphate transport system permease protein n=1 Tax=Chromohalobacter canadensis TaxID=141389 RepID=A0ABZ0Y9H0_9GAMM|nr:phosphate ABC transporter permease subunit PstC [Chromohalobacter canadensis]MCK0768306.1 phosphate ABC transporter permease subunit PstC [Chromohalobacter canadensis]WQH08713.1 phosphate ABC transporter permease subunit PstC [Chromohalobacter canadensis]
MHVSTKRLASSRFAFPGASDKEIRILKRNALIDRAFERSTQAFALAVLLLLGAILVSLCVSSWDTLSAHAVDFLTGDRWAANMEIFGALPAIYGTLVTSLIAVAIAVPVSFGIAIFLTEKCPEILRRPLGITVELLAGIPSIIYGMWGVEMLAPFLNHIFPDLFPAGSGLATAGLVLAIMIIPFITAISRDVMLTVPPITRESAYGLGCTTWEVVRGVIFPTVRHGMMGGVVLGLGRALGETMAVTFVIGNNLFFHPTITGQGTSIAALIANQFPEADGAQRSALLALGLVLFLITFAVLATARYMLNRIERRAA